MATLEARRVQVDVPSEVASLIEDSTIAHEMLTLWLLEQVRDGHVGFGRAAELAGINLVKFLDLMYRHDISPFPDDIEEIRHELV